MSDPLEPLPQGSTIGMFGGGQLGRMLIMEARRMGYVSCVLDPDPDCPAGQLAERTIAAPYTDADAAQALSQASDALTYEFEHVDADAVALAERYSRLHPSANVLRAVQHRVRQRETLGRIGVPMPKTFPVIERNDLDDAVRALGLPAVLKTATSGYDGKGQAVLRDATDFDFAYESLRPMSDALILEEFVDFQCEISTICARNEAGETVVYPVVENRHVDGILDVTIAPGNVSMAVAEEAQRIARDIAIGFDLVGLVCVEMFLTRDGQVLVNEVAPRPHNSGHYTLDVCAPSQFEQLLRVLCRLPLAEPEMMSPAVMVNLLGEVWLDAPNGQPAFADALHIPGIKLHLYGKREARRGRKMGHITAVAPDVRTALEHAMKAREVLTGRKPSA